MNIATQFLTQLRTNVEDWRPEELDLPTYSANQQELWAEVRATGPDVEKAGARGALEGVAGGRRPAAGR
jgi:hypothetical protein